MDRAAAGYKFRSFLKISLVCLAASLVNPYGYKILFFPFNLVSNRYLMDHVQEFVDRLLKNGLAGFEYQL